MEDRRAFVSLTDRGEHISSPKTVRSKAENDGIAPKGKIKMMKKTARFALVTIALLLCSCAKTPSDTEESRAEASRVYSYDCALSDGELAERYADLSAKLYSCGKENAEQTISAEGLAYMNEARAKMDQYFDENGGEEERSYAKENGMYDFMLEDRQFFPAADNGLFAVYGYRMLGALCASYYDVFFLSASEETLLYSGQLLQADTDFLGNGEKLMIVSPSGAYGVFCVLDRSGELTRLNPRECEIVVPAEAE